MQPRRGAVAGGLVQHTYIRTFFCNLNGIFRERDCIFSSKKLIETTSSSLLVENIDGIFVQHDVELHVLL